MELAVGLSNIGAFVLQAVTLGQCVRNKTDDIETVLDNARNELRITMKVIIDYYDIVHDSDLNPIFFDYVKLKEAVTMKIEQSRNKKSFLTTAKTYKSRKQAATDTFNKCKDLRYRAEDVSDTAELQLKKEKKRQQDLTTLPESEEPSPERRAQVVLHAHQRLGSLRRPDASADPFEENISLLSIDHSTAIRA